jgi:hypothetical protein
MHEKAPGWGPKSRYASLSGGVPWRVLFPLLSNVGATASSHARGQGRTSALSNHGAGRVACSATRLVCRSDVIMGSAGVNGNEPQPIFQRHCHCRVPQKIVPGSAQPSRAFLAYGNTCQGGRCNDVAFLHTGISMLRNFYIDSASFGLPTSQSVSMIIPPADCRSPLSGRGKWP